MSQITNSKQYDLEGRSFEFAREVKEYIKKLPRTISNVEYGKQLTRSSGSVAANYIEANESLSRKDFILRAKISKKEAKESRLWLRLTEPSNNQEKEQLKLIRETKELMRILGSIIEKSLKK